MTEFQVIDACPVSLFERERDRFVADRVDVGSSVRESVNGAVELTVTEPEGEGGAPEFVGVALRVTDSERDSVAEVDWPGPVGLVDSVKLDV